MTLTVEDLRPRVSECEYRHRLIAGIVDELTIEYGYATVNLIDGALLRLGIDVSRWNPNTPTSVELANHLNAATGRGVIVNVDHGTPRKWRSA